MARTSVGQMRHRESGKSATNREFGGRTRFFGTNWQQWMAKLRRSEETAQPRSLILTGVRNHFISYDFAVIVMVCAAPSHWTSSPSDSATNRRGRSVLPYEMTGTTAVSYTHLRAPRD